jgi:hypothetical protein
MSNSQNGAIEMNCTSVPQSPTVGDKTSPPIGESANPNVVPTQEDDAMNKNRTPVILHPFAGWGLIVLCVALAAAVIVLYCISHSRNGFPIHAGRTFRDDVVRFLWSSGPALPMTVVTGLILAPLAFNMWLHAPYTELEQASGTGETTIFMNWTTKGPFRRIHLAWKHRRLGLVTLGIATLLSGFLPVVASGLLGPQTIIVRV